MPRESQAVVSIFVSSAPQDQTLADELKEHLRPLEEDRHISLWEDMENSAQTTREHAVIPSSISDAAGSTRRRSKSNLARPYMWRLSSLSRLICPSTWPWERPINYT
jgi:hypothetical protein